MYLISIKGYQNAKVHHLRIIKTDEIWVSMKDIGDCLGVTNISNLVLKEIYGIYEERKLTKEEIKNYKMTEREIFEKFDNLSNDELNTKSSKLVFKHCRGEKKKGIRAIDGFRKQLMIPDFEISKCP